jgi:hypothetical protein
MTQALYAHMNNKKIKIKKKGVYTMAAKAWGKDGTEHWTEGA